MTRPKPKNWELELQTPPIHNPPDAFYFKFKNFVICVDNLLEPPTVITHHVLIGETVRKVREWLDLNEIPYKSEGKWKIKVERIPKKGMDKVYMQWHEENNTPYKDGYYIMKTAYPPPGKSELFMWVDVIKPLTHVFDLSKFYRKHLFSGYQESMIAKLTKAIESIDRAIGEIWNDETRLFREWQFLTASKERYESALKEFQSKHKRTGEHKFLYPLLKPVIDKLHEAGISDYRLLGKSSKNPSPLYSLFKIFGYGNFQNVRSVRSILKYVKEY